MQQQIKLDEGWVPVELLLKFRRLAAILGDRDKSVIADAIRKSSLLEVSITIDNDACVYIKYKFVNLIERIKMFFSTFLFSNCPHLYLNSFIRVFELQCSG